MFRTLSLYQFRKLVISDRRIFFFFPKRRSQHSRCVGCTAQQLGLTTSVNLTFGNTVCSNMCKGKYSPQTLLGSITSAKLSILYKNRLSHSFSALISLYRQTSASEV